MKNSLKVILHFRSDEHKTTKQKYRDSKNDWRGSCEIKMNNLQLSLLLTNLKVVSEI